MASLSQRLEDLLLAPSVSWPSMDREFGWLYVKAPMDFRIDSTRGGVVDGVGDERDRDGDGHGVGDADLVDVRAG